MPLLLSCAHNIDPATLRLASRQDIEITNHDRLATPAMVKGALADLAKVKKEKQAETLMIFLRENSEIFKIQAPEMELKLLRSDDDELGFTHYRYARLIKEVPVYGDELILHVNNKSQLYMVNGQYHPTGLLDSEPALTAAKAGAIALEQGSPTKWRASNRPPSSFIRPEKSCVSPGTSPCAAAWPNGTILSTPGTAAFSSIRTAKEADPPARLETAEYGIPSCRMLQIFFPRNNPDRTLLYDLKGAPPSMQRGCSISTQKFRRR